MSVIDERIVKMQFQNSLFESGVKQTLSTLEKLKEKLNFKDSTKNLQNLEKAGKNFNLDAMGKAADTVASRFSNLGVIGMTVLQNLTNSALNAGRRMASVFTVKPIMDGFREYETQINAVQTILANTQHEGTNLKQVNAALDELNTYADKTIYNFTEMTRNIGTFTAAGVKLDTSVAAIKGIANLAAVSGSTSQQASTAMYQLSQALAAGKVNLQDWNSVVNAGMGGKVFQDALLETARVHGIAVDEMIKKRGSFRESLSREGWLTADILTETLAKFTGDMTAEQLRQIGYTEEQTQAILKMGETANDAATKVKTFTQLWETVEEALGSGWAQTWRILVGDFDEAKESLTELSDLINKPIGEMSDARNKLLQGWKDLGGRTAVIDTIRSSVESLGKVLGSIKGAWQEVFPPMTSQQLFDITNRLKEFVQSLAPTDKMLNNIKRTAKGIFSLLDLVKTGVMSLLSPIGKLIGSEGFRGIGDSLLEITGNLGEFVTKMSESIKAVGIFETIAGTFDSVFTAVGDAISAIIARAGELSGAFVGNFDFLDKFASTVANVFQKTKDVVGDVIGWLKENVTLRDVFTGLKTGGFIILVQNFSVLVDNFKDAVSTVKGVLKDLTSWRKDLVKSGEHFKDFIKVVSDALTGLTSSVKTTSLVLIAGAVTILVASIKSLATLDLPTVVAAVAVIAGIMDLLDSALKSMVDMFRGIKVGQMLASSVTLLGVATSITILTFALKKIAELDTEHMLTGLSGVVGLLGVLSLFIKKTNLMTLSPSAAFAVVQISATLVVMAEALKQISALDTDKLVVGLTGMLAAFGMLSRFINKTYNMVFLTPQAGAAVFAIAAGLRIMSDALVQISDIPFDKLLVGIVGVFGALSSLSTAVKILGKTSPSIKGMISLVIFAELLPKIVEPLKTLTDYSMDQISVALRGAVDMMFALSASVALLGRFGGMSTRMLAGAGSMAIVAESLDKIVKFVKPLANISWDSIQKGLLAMGAALGLFVSAIIILSDFGGGVVGNLAGATSILIAAQALGPIADAIDSVGNHSWDAINKGLTGLTRTIEILALTFGILGRTTGIKGIMGAAAVLIGAQALAPIADALEKLRHFDSEEISTSVDALGDVLMILAGLSGIIGLAAPVGAVLGAGSILLAAQALGPITDALKDVALSDPERVKSSVEAIGDILVILGGMNAIIGLAAPVGAFIGSASILIAAQALGPIADALDRVAIRDPERVTSSVEALGDILVVLGATSAIVGSVGPGLALLGSASILIAAQALAPIADAIEQLAGYEWDDIKAGVDGISGVLTALAGGTFVNSFGIIGSLNVLIAVQPLQQLADALERFGSMEWDIIERGVFGMQGALNALAGGTFVNTLGTIGGINVLIAVQPLEKLANALERFGSMDWGTILRGTDGMQRALNALAGGTFVNTLGTIGALNVMIAVQPLEKLAEALKKFGSMGWDEIERGITAMQGALNALGGGTFVNTLNTIGGLNVLIAVQPLEQLAEALKKFGSMDWGTIIRGTNGMRGALDALAGGTFANTLNTIGGLNVMIAVQPLEQLAEGLKKFGSMAWDEIDRGIQAMSGALGAIAFGGFANTLGVIGDLGIAVVAKPLGDLADSVKKWRDVEVPETLGNQLATLGVGLEAFGGGISELVASGTMAMAAAPLGVMAESVKKWEGVVVPEELPTNLNNLAVGLNAFNMDFFSGGNMAAIVDPLGNMAGSVDKWKDVSFQDGELPEKIKSLAQGVNEFNLAFFTGGNLEKIITPFANFADSVNKWKDVEIKEGLGEKVKELAQGISGFDLEFFTGDNLAKIVGPFNELADATKKWWELTLPNFSIEYELYGIKNGVASLQELDAGKLNENKDAMDGIFEVVKKIVSIDIAVGFEEKFRQMKDGLNALNEIDVSGVKAKLDELPGAFTEVGSALTDAVSKIRSFAGQFGDAGKELAGKLRDNLVQGIQDATENGKNAAQNLITAICDAAIVKMDSYRAQFFTGAVELINQFISGIESGKQGASDAAAAVVASAKDGISGGYQDFYDAGLNLSAGFASGISDGASGAITAAVSMATSAIQAAKDALGEKSPSRVFKQIGRYASEGMAIGLTDYSSKVTSATKAVAMGSVSTMERSVGAIVAAGKSRFRPRITPVLDTSKAVEDSGFLNNLSPKSSITASIRLPDAAESANVYLQQLVDSQLAMNQSLTDLKMEVDEIRYGVKSIDGRPLPTLSVDGKVIAKAIAKPMNRELGVLSKRGKL